MTTAGSADRWREVWAKRSLDRSHATTLSMLMAADGLDTAFGEISEAAWCDSARRWAARLRARSGASVYEVGCGAGAFLWVLERLGCSVGGIDLSASLIESAREVMPAGQFDIGEAIDLAAEPKADVVVSFGAFLYFPNLDYAAAVIAAMAARARTAVAILDLPDLATRADALAHRIELAGGEAAYRQRYDGLGHIYYDRRWVADRLRDSGLADVATATQDIRGYANGPFRFNAWGFAQE
jgi:SAM-dependent methyltransferase